MGKGENAGNLHFLIFPKCFLPFLKQISVSESHSFSCLQMLSIWTSPKFRRLVKSSGMDSFAKRVEKFGGKGDKTMLYALRGTNPII